MSNGPVTGRFSTAFPRPEPLLWLARLMLLVLCSVVVWWLVLRSSWYLAIDQFGYLTFASDLAAGRIAHPWPILPILGQFFPPGFDVDVLAQAYVYRGGELFCRYSPGFPMLLAIADIFFGPGAMHYVNPIAAAVLLGVLYVLVARLFGSEWLGLGVALLATLLPTYVLLWSISPLRDVPAHAAALGGLAILLVLRDGRRSSLRWGAVGFLLGFAVTIRVDAILYLIPFVGLAPRWRSWRRQELLGAAVGLAIGVAPLLVYNAVALGNPLRPTQGMELERILSQLNDSTGGEEELAGDLPSWLSPAPAHADEGDARSTPRGQRFLQGGGLRLSNLPETLPASFDIYAGVFGRLGLALIFVGALFAWRNPTTFWLTVPYVLVATLFFSMWPRADPRYLLGVILFGSVLLANGALALASLAADLRRDGIGRWGAFVVWIVASGVIAFLLGRPDLAATNAQPMVLLVLAGLVAAALGSGLWLGGERVRQWFAVGLGVGLSLILLARVPRNMGLRASFQAPQVEEARATVEAATEDRAVIFTTIEIGRPAENINFYTDAQAIYLREVTRWGVSPGYLLDELVKAGFRPYLLLPEGDARRWIESKFVYPWFRPEMVANIPATESRRWFVASAFHDGVPLWLIRMHRRAERSFPPDS